MVTNSALNTVYISVYWVTVEGFIYYLASYLWYEDSSFKVLRNRLLHHTIMALNTIQRQMILSLFV